MKMKTRYDIAIIGGGVIGLTLARALSAHIRALVIVDASGRTPPATAAAAGMLAPSFEKALGGDALYELSARSLAMWRPFAADLTRETGLDIDFRTDGVLEAALNGNGVQSLETACATLLGKNADVEMLSGEAARALEPALSQDIKAALYARRDAQVDPVKLLAALRASLEKREATFIDDSAAATRDEARGWRITLSGGDGFFADQIIIATGAAPAWRIDGVARPPVFPVKGEAFSVAAPARGNALTRVVRGPGAYVCPKAGGRVLIGATELYERDDITVSPAAIDLLRSGAAALAPALGEAPEIARWAGLRPATPDGMPILGADPRGAPGASIALGHHRNGVLLAPASAAALAGEILGRPADIDLAPFRPNRFG